ncbi:MAG: hypothetical protein ACI8RD_009985, partial [Bacillariaceae sp.]
LFFLFRLLSNISYQHHPPTVLHIAEELNASSRRHLYDRNLLMSKYENVVPPSMSLWLTTGLHKTLQ